MTGPSEQINKRSYQITNKQKRATYINVSHRAGTQHGRARRPDGLEHTRDGEATGGGCKSASNGSGTKDGGADEVNDAADLVAVRECRPQNGSDAHEQDEERHGDVDSALGGIKLFADLDQRGKLASCYRYNMGGMEGGTGK